MTGPDKRAREYLASIGAKGGKAKGKSKVRGDSDYYKRISQKAAAARKAKSDGSCCQYGECTMLPNCKKRINRKVTK